MADYIEGKRPVIEALRAQMPLISVLMADNVQQDSQIKDILRKAKQYDVPVKTVPRKVLDERSERGSHQGVMAHAKPYQYSSVTDILVPVMACLYVMGALVIIFAHVGELPAVFGMIFQDAFTGHAAVGGFAGATIMAAIRWGAARGVYSNEAGVGSTIAGHCTAETDHPIRQAQFGIFEVFMDTIVICTITSLAVLASGVWTQEGLSSGQLALAAFQSVFGNFGAIFVAITVFLFVFSTIISAGFFGQIQAEILFGRRFSKVWVFIYPLFICIACAFSNVTTMYMILDGFLAVVVILNMIGLLVMCKQVKDLQKEYYNTPGMYYLADRAAKEAKRAQKDAK